MQAHKWAIALNRECEELGKRIKELEECVSRNTHNASPVYLRTVVNIAELGTIAQLSKTDGGIL